MKFLKSFLLVLGFCAVHNSYAGFVDCSVYEGSRNGCSTAAIKVKAGQTPAVVIGFYKVPGPGAGSGQAIFRVRNAVTGTTIWSKKATAYEIVILPTASNDLSLKGDIKKPVGVKGYANIGIKSP